MAERRKNGFVIEMMLIFMLITFGFCILITTIIIGLNKERKYAKANIQMQADLNQIGEYYLRYIQQDGVKFPDGSETEFVGETPSGITIKGKPLTNQMVPTYGWMGEDTIKINENGISVAYNPIKEFFSRINDKYKCETYYSIKKSSAANFYQTYAIYRKLIVRSKDDDQIKMIIEIAEIRDKETKSTRANYVIENWSIGDNLTDITTDSDKYEEDNYSMLQIIWQLIGNFYQSTRLLFQGQSELAFEKFLEGGEAALTAILETWDVEIN